ncbi:MAG: SUMF1/EgtB/PvdO family nonheme iron enzyme [Anaerolineae bacterium]
MPTTDTPTNPYVGPRTFTAADRKRFFGRETEAAGLLARVVSERLLLFYAQSGAGKSSLINARLIPQLREEEGFSVLPVGRVAGQLPASVAQVDNIFLFNLMAGLDGGGGSPAQWAHLGLSEFLEHLVTDDGLAWRYDPAAEAEPAPTGEAALPAADAGPAPRFALVIDQFEEIITGHPDRWREREGFFRQLDAALQADPNLWVVLSLREDYVAALDPYAPLVFNRLRARFYMERMGVAAGLDAIRKPAELAGRPFAEGVAEQLADNLRQVRVPGRQDTVAGQYVEPVQLQVVCYQLWENIQNRPLGLITTTDLAEAGDVDRALTQFYEETLAAALADPVAAGVSERQMRAWFDEKLITEEGTRGLVHQDADETGRLPNAVVRALQRRFLVRAEARGGDTWIELVHDRFVEPIRASNAAWFPQHLSALQRQATLWDEQGRSSGLLLRDAALAEAEAWTADHAGELESHEQEFLDACREARAAAEREQRQSRRIRILGVVAGIVAMLAIALAIWGWRSSVEATRQKKIAVEKSALAQVQLDLQAGLSLLQEAYALKEKGDAQGAIDKFQAAKATQTDLGIDVETEIADVRRQVATQWVQEGEALAKNRDFPAAEAKFKAALALEPPPDTPVYVYVPAGEFVMGAGAEDERLSKVAEYDAFNERPQHPVTLEGYWIQRTEVTNAQYRRCVEAKGCERPSDGNIRYRFPQFATQPVEDVTWYQARDYARWMGGRLPTEAEWEKACRGGLEIPENPLVGWGQTKNNDQVDRLYPWGAKPDPTGDLLNFSETGLGTWTAVGSYPKGASPYGALDMAGNVWEWTSSAYKEYPYDPKDGREDPGASSRVLRGGSFNFGAGFVRCALRNFRNFPLGWYDNSGFRVVVSPGF